MTLTREELLVLLIEECSEVVQAATKCLRFGFDHDEPGYGVNSTKLAMECGDVIGVMYALPLDWSHIQSKARTKIARALAAKHERSEP